MIYQYLRQCHFFILIFHSIIMTQIRLQCTIKNLVILAQFLCQLLMQDFVICSIAISAFEKCKQWDTALGLLEGMSHQWLKLDVVSLAVGIRVLVGGLQWACKRKGLGFYGFAGVGSEIRIVVDCDFAIPNLA